MSTDEKDQPARSQDEGVLPTLSGSPSAKASAKTAPAESAAAEDAAAKREGAEADDAKAGDATGDDAKGDDADAKDEPAAAPPRPTPGQWGFLLAVAGVTAGLDLWSKAWAIKALSARIANPPPLCVPPPGASHYLYQRNPVHVKTVIRGFLDFHYAENCGGAWGLLHGARESLRKPFFLLVTFGAVVFILHLYRNLEPNQRAMRWALPLVLGGAIGNLVDRMRLGYVVDFIDAHWREAYHWPTFNVADIAITVGIGLMLLEYIFGPKPKPAKAKPKVKPAAT